MSPLDAADAARFARLADLVVDVAREVRLRSGVDAPGVPLNQTQSQVMRFVHGSPDCLASEIAHAVGIKRTNVSAAIQELKGLGYVTTHPDAQDGRAVRIRPTPLAEDTIRRLRIAWAASLSEAWDAAAGETSGLPAAEAALESLLEGLRATRGQALRSAG